MDKTEVVVHFWQKYIFFCIVNGFFILFLQAVGFLQNLWLKRKGFIVALAKCWGRWNFFLRFLAM